VAGLAALGVLGVAAAWAVERSARWERAVRRATWPAVLLAAVLASASAAGHAGREVTLWSGPWGWAVQPGTDSGTARWAGALALLAAAAVAGAIAAERSCGDCPAERHLRRAEARAGAIASLGTFDARTARRALERVGAAGAGRRAIGLVRVRDARLAVLWRDAAAALGHPGRVAEGAVLAAAGSALALTGADRPLVVPAAMLLVYLGAARTMWPLRSELDVPPRARVLLRPRLGRVLLDHTVLPAAVTAGVAALAAAGCALARGIPGDDAAAALMAVAVTPPLTFCAAMAARRGGRVSPTVFVTAAAADPSGGAAALLGWFALWPSIAATVGAVPVLLAANGGPGAATFALCLTAVAGASLAGLVAREVPES
jgi:hypothetical protein